MLKEEQKAPTFELIGDDGAMHKLEDFAGKWLVLYFYPKDMTSGCTTEACDFNTNLDDFSEFDAHIVGISRDNLASHVRFKGRHALGFLLLSDPDMKVHKLYGAYGEKILYGKAHTGSLRTTFLISPQLKIERVWRNVRVKNHVAQVLQAVQKTASASEPLMSSVVRR